MIKIKIFLILFFGCFMHPTFSIAQLKIFQFEQIDSLQKVEKKTVVIFIHTDWCRYCQAMKATTFKDKTIIDKLNRNFYFIDFNAEDKRDIFFNGRTFEYKPTGQNVGVHQLAEQLATVDNKIAFPTLCFLNMAYEIIHQTTDYKNKFELEKLLTKLK
jgi:thioredoxin-related protein